MHYPHDGNVNDETNGPAVVSPEKVTIYGSLVFPILHLTFAALFFSIVLTDTERFPVMDRWKNSAAVDVKI